VRSLRLAIRSEMLVIGVRCSSLNATD
jgi:hypothetical protein